MGKVTSENYGDLLLRSVKEAHNHQKGLITLNSEKLCLPIKVSKHTKTSKKAKQ